MIDIGLSAKRINGHLNTHGIEAKSLAGMLLTHEHGDHTKGLRVFSANSSVPVFTNPLTDDPEITPRALKKAAEAYRRSGKAAEADKALKEAAERFPVSLMNSGI